MKFDDIKKLHQKKFREEFGYFLLEGEHLVQELQKAARARRTPADQRDLFHAGIRHWASPLTTHVVNSRHMTQISETRSPQGIAAVVPLLPPPAPTARRARHLSARDPGSRQPRHHPAHAGVVRRTSAACSVPDSVDVHNGKVVRASMGAIFHVPVEIDVPLDALPARFAPHRQPRPAGRSRSPRRRSANFDCYLFGNEARGLPREALAALNAQPFTIAGTGAIESLNVAATVNICQYELHRP